MFMHPPVGIARVDLSPLSLGRLRRRDAVLGSCAGSLASQSIPSDRISSHQLLVPWQNEGVLQVAAEKPPAGTVCPQNGKRD